MKKYAISDIHGCFKTFKSLLEKLKFSKRDYLYILGDLIDRGPSSKEVIDYIWKLERENYKVFCVKGNHDQMMLDGLQDLYMRKNWMFNGGITTMESFNANTISEIPQQYFQFIEEMPYYYEVDEYILVHAGFLFYMPNPFEELHSMLWQRNWYNHINYTWLKNRIIVHGHTPIVQNEVKLMVKNLNKNQYLNIDTGCVHKGKREGFGHLTCFDLKERKLIFQENLDF